MEFLQIPDRRERKTYRFFPVKGEAAFRRHRIQGQILNFIPGEYFRCNTVPAGAEIIFMPVYPCSLARKLLPCTPCPIQLFLLNIAVIINVIVHIFTIE